MTISRIVNNPLNSGTPLEGTKALALSVVVYLPVGERSS